MVGACEQRRRPADGGLHVPLPPADRVGARRSSPPGASGGTTGPRRLRLRHQPGVRTTSACRRRSAGGSLMDVGCYPLNFARAVFGGAVRSRAAAQVVVPAGSEVERRVAAALDFGDGRMRHDRQQLPCPARLLRRGRWATGPPVHSAPVHTRDERHSGADRARRRDHRAATSRGWTNTNWRSSASAWRSAQEHRRSCRPATPSSRPTLSP